MNEPTNRPFIIIVPTDFSKPAKNGLKTAIKLSEKLSGRIHLINWVEPPKDVLLRSSLEIDQDQSRQQDIFTLKLIKKHKKKLSAVRQKYAQHSITTSVRMGEMSVGVAELVDELQAGLVVMGTSGERALDEVLSGNHAEQVAMKVACPVMTVRKYHKSAAFSNLILAIDLTEQSEEINTLMEFTHRLGTRIHLLFADTSSIGQKKEALLQLKLMAKKHQMKNYTLNYISGSDQAESICEMARIKHADMIAIVTESTGFVMELFANRPANDLIKDAKRPVLTINSEASSQ